MNVAGLPRGGIRSGNGDFACRGSFDPVPTRLYAYPKKQATRSGQMIRDEGALRNSWKRPPEVLSQEFLRETFPALAGDVGSG